MLQTITMDRRAVRSGSAELGRYFFASLVALAVDMLVLLILARFIHYAAAAAVGFIAGSIVHYRISVALVFRRRRLWSSKWTELAIFVGGGMLGLMVNVAVIALLVESLASPLPAAKVIAAGASLMAGYGVRKLSLF